MAKYRGQEINLKPTESMRKNAQRALDWRKEFDRGGTEVGVARARDIINADELSPETVRRMVSYFARHEVDKQAEGFNSGEEGFPSAGRIAWDLWGGDAGKTWSESKDSQLDKIEESKNMSKTCNERKFINVSFEQKEVKQEGNIGIVRGYASTFGNVDRGDDMVVKGAFEKTIADHKNRQRPVRMLWQHNGNDLIGGYPADKMFEDENGLFVEGHINLETQKGREAYALAKQGVLSDFSIGFIIRSYDIDKRKDGMIRIIKEAELFEVSLVGEPMNQQANFTEVKSAVTFQDLPLAPRDREWDSDAAINRVRGFLDSTDEPSPEYKRAFLWCDAENKENFTAYKLPIADVIYGRLYAIPRAIFASAAALRGARGGVDIPEDDRNAVISNVNRYYEKMGIESPFNETSSFRLDDVKSLSEREFESLLRSGVCFSQKMAKQIISLLNDNAQRDVDAKSQRDAELKDTLEKLLTTLK